jgi:hypothetical protein
MCSMSAQSFKRHLVAQVKSGLTPMSDVDILPIGSMLGNSHRPLHAGTELA